MLIKIISVGNKLNQWQLKEIEFYTKQLPKNLAIEFIDLKSQQNPNYSIEEVIQKESSLILSKISKNDFVVSWDSSGVSMTSKNFSNFILKSQSNMSSILFIIGGSFGLSLEVKQRSNKILSASQFTFPHRLFRLLLVEQIYRAYTIINNMPYHK